MTSRPARWSSTRSPRTWPARPGRAAAPGTSPTWTSRALDAGLAQRLGWAAAEDRPGRRPVRDAAAAECRGRPARSTCTGRPGPRTRWTGARVFSKPGGGTRVGERLSGLPLTLCSDPALPGLACSPFVVAHASRRDTSVFDNGLAPGPHRLDPRRRTGRADPDPAHRRALRAAGHPRHRQPRPGRPAGLRGVARGHGGPHRARVCCSPASGTSARWTRRPCC